MAVFDKAAQNYDQWYNSKLGAFVDMIETKLAFELFKTKKGQSVLDAGCGTGNFSCKLADMGCKVTGIDISHKMLKLAKEKACNSDLDIDFKLMDLYHLDFPDEHFDSVFSMAAFEFIKYPEVAMDELFRVTKKNGAIMIGTINRDSKWGELYTKNEAMKNSVFKHAHFKTPQQIEALNSDNLVALRQCLFTPPDVSEDSLSLEKEVEFSHSERGGFLCALWIKP